jgi:hypothetical protein
MTPIKLKIVIANAPNYNFVLQLLYFYFHDKRLKKMRKEWAHHPN